MVISTALVLAMGCGKQETGQPPQTSTKKNPQPDLSGGPFPEATPESQGIPRGVLDRLSELVTGFVEAEEIVGAELLVIKNRRTVMHDVFGHDDHSGDKALGKNTIFSIRSMTKPLTGAVAQMLIDDGVLKLTDPVAKHLDSFDNERSRGVTIEHLLTPKLLVPFGLAKRSTMLSVPIKI